MNEVRIFRIGPLDDEGNCLYVPVSPARPLEAVDARVDADGIRKIIEQWPEGTYVCSPDLAAAAARLGIGVAALEATTEISRLWTAMAIAQEPDLDAITTRWPVMVLMRSTSDFFLRDVRRRCPARLTMEIELRGDRTAQWYGALLTTPHPGLVLFDTSADAKRCALLDDEQPSFVAERDHLRVEFEPAPAYAAEWIRDFYDIDCMPRLTRRRSEPVIADDEDAFVIGGVLSTLGLVEDVRETVYSTTQTPEREVRTFISPGEPWPFLHVP